MGAISILFCEFVGAFSLAFILGSFCQVSELVGKDGSIEAYAPSVYGLTYMGLLYAIGASGCPHLNPAASVAAALVRREPWIKSMEFVLVQCLGGIIGGLVVFGIFGQFGLPIVPVNVSSEVLMLEALYTCMLSFVTLGVTARRNHPQGSPNQFWGIAISAVLIAAGASQSGTHFPTLNPAMALGLASDLSEALLLTGAQFAGAAAGALLFGSTHPEDFLCEALWRMYYPPLPLRLQCEFIGTFFIVLTYCASTSSSRAWCTAAALAAMIYGVGDVSGGHFNPAVTLAVTLCRKVKITIVEGFLYMGVQVAAGIVAALVVGALVGGSTGLQPLQPMGETTEWGAYLLEMIFTSVLAIAQLSTAYVKGVESPLKRNFYFGVAIALARLVGTIVCQPLSGGALNPAVALAAPVSMAGSSNVLEGYGVHFALAELSGGALAVSAFVLVHPEVYMSKRVT